MASSCSPARRMTPLSRSTVARNFSGRRRGVVLRPVVRLVGRAPRRSRRSRRSACAARGRSSRRTAAGWRGPGRPAAMASASERLACSAAIREVRAALSRRRSATQRLGPRAGLGAAPPRGCRTWCRRRAGRCRARRGRRTPASSRRSCSASGGSLSASGMAATSCRSSWDIHGMVNAASGPASATGHELGRASPAAATPAARRADPGAPSPRVVRRERRQRRRDAVDPRLRAEVLGHQLRAPAETLTSPCITTAASAAASGETGVWAGTSCSPGVALGGDRLAAMSGGSVSLGASTLAPAASEAP